MFLFLAVHVWVLAKKHRSAFVYAIIGCSLGVFFGCLARSVPIAIMNCVFCGLHIRAYCLWGDNRSENQDF
jgi:hypothetical protein